MTLENSNSILILADESANWEIGGLRQLDRLALAANELAAEKGSEVEIIVFWKPEIAPAKRWLPSHPRLTNSRVSTAEEQTFKSDRFELLSTRLLVTRHGLAEFLSREIANDALLPNPADWMSLNDAFEKSHRIADARMADRWRLISSKDEISASERWLLRSTGKSYDGFVSRHLNRPMSRLVSRFILHSPITPNQWTLLILLLAVAAFAFLSRGTYIGFVIGAMFYQLHSILDGCDGEIARIKYLDSKRGPGIDALGDLIALLLFVAGLAVGLFHSANGGARWLFLAEGAVAFVLIALRLGRHTRELLARGMDAVRSSEHGELVRESAEHYFGRRLHRFALAMTGRDVVFLLFLVLTLAGLAPVIMHLLFAYSLGAVLLLLKGHSMRSARQVRPVLP